MRRTAPTSRICRKTARELACRLYTVSERKKRAAEVLQYNALAQSGPEITRLAQGSPAEAPAQSEPGIRRQCGIQ
jgi:putative DNA methylase